MSQASETTSVRGRVRVEHGAKRIRAYLGGEVVADTIRPLLVWEKPYYPTYYFPAADVRTGLLSADGDVIHSPSRGDARTFTVAAGGREARGAALRYDQSPFEELRDALGDRPVDIPMMVKHGFYPRYRLLVTYFIEKKGWDVEQLLQSRLTEDQAEEMMRADAQR